MVWWFMHRSVNHRAAPDRVDRDHSCQGNAYRTAAGVRNEAQEHFRAVGAEGHAQLQVRRLACVGTDACAPNDSARLGSAVIGCRSAHIGQCSPPDARHGAAVAVPLTQAHAALGAAAAATNPSRRKSRAKPRRSEVAAAIRTRKSHLLRPFPPAHALGLGESGWPNAMRCYFSAAAEAARVDTA